MREILFRGKRVDNGEWVLGATFATIYQENTALVFMPQAGESVKADVMNSNDRILTSIHGKFYQVFPATVGQYTGLTDKNGKKIFEGDIVSTPRYNGVVVYGTGCYCIEHENNSPAIDIVMNDFDVYIIGNIHDNPELLEVGE